MNRNNDCRQYNSRRQALRRRRRIKRFLRKAVSFLLMLCICIGMIFALREISELYNGMDRKDPKLSVQLNKSDDGMDTDILKELEALAEKNQEAVDFVANYPDRAKYLGIEIDLSEEISSDTVPFLMQWDKRWGYESYGDSILGLSGCGPTCLSMAYLYFTQDLTGNPREMGIFCEEEGYYTLVGTSWSLWTEGVAKLGLSGSELALDETVIRNVLSKGHLVVCSMRPGDFTTSGHYILIHGCNEEGFLIHDPNKKSNSEKIWSYDTLQWQIKNLWAIHG